MVHKQKIHAHSTTGSSGIKNGCNETIHYDKKKERNGFVSHYLENNYLPKAFSVCFFQSRERKDVNETRINLFFPKKFRQVYFSLIEMWFLYRKKSMQTQSLPTEGTHGIILIRNVFLTHQKACRTFVDVPCSRPNCWKLINKDTDITAVISALLRKLACFPTLIYQKYLFKWSNENILTEIKSCVIMAEKPWNFLNVKRCT